MIPLPSNMSKGLAMLNNITLWSQLAGVLRLDGRDCYRIDMYPTFDHTPKRFYHKNGAPRGSPLY